MVVNHLIMENNAPLWQRPVAKFFIIAVLAIFMLIPLALVREQVNDRATYHESSISDITSSWGRSQNFTGPWIAYDYQRKVGSEDKTETVKAELYPENLDYKVKTVTKMLHRSIFDVPVYTADIEVSGEFVLDEHFCEAGVGNVVLKLNDLKGIQGSPVFRIGDKDLKVKSSGTNIIAEVSMEGEEGDVVPFSVSLSLNGSESLFFTPSGNLTTVEMASDYPDPSFSGDFLPVERDVRPDGFTAKWSVSQITLSGPLSDSFGVRLIEPVTQYRQTDRAAKYGMLIIFLVFIAGFFVEIISKKPINLIQYLVIGASLVLFYSLLLAFSDFLSFGLSYLIASVMTVAALGGYFFGIVKNKWSLLLTGLVALAYGVIYILLQMETFAFLAGTLLLFAILCVVMFLTRDLRAM